MPLLHLVNRFACLEVENTVDSENPEICKPIHADVPKAEVKTTLQMHIPKWECWLPKHCVVDPISGPHLLNFKVELQTTDMGKQFGTE